VSERFFGGEQQTTKTVMTNPTNSDPDSDLPELPSMQDLNLNLVHDNLVYLRGASKENKRQSGRQFWTTIVLAFLVIVGISVLTWRGCVTDNAVVASNTAHNGLAEYTTNALVSLKDRLSGKINDVDKDLHATKKKVEENTESIGTLSNKIDTLDTKITGLTTTVGTLSSTVGGLDTKIGALDTKVGGLDAKMTGMETRIMAVLDGRHQAATNMIADATNRISGLDFMARARLDELEKWKAAQEAATNPPVTSTTTTTTTATAPLSAPVTNTVTSVTTTTPAPTAPPSSTDRLFELILAGQDQSAKESREVVKAIGDLAAAVKNAPTSTAVQPSAEDPLVLANIPPLNKREKQTRVSESLQHWKQCFQDWESADRNARGSAMRNGPGSYSARCARETANDAASVADEAMRAYKRILQESK